MKDTTQARNQGWIAREGPLLSEANPSGWEKQSEAKDNDLGEPPIRDLDETFHLVPQRWTDSAKRYWISGERLVRAHPIRSVLVGVGLGAVMGRLFKRGKQEAKE